MAVEPGAGAMMDVAIMAALLEAVAFARIDRELAGDAEVDQRAVELLRLAERAAMVELAMDDQRRRALRTGIEHRRAFRDQLPAGAPLMQRRVDDQVAEAVVAGVLQADQVGNARKHHAGGEARGGSDRPGCEIAAIARAGDADPPRGGDALRDAPLRPGNDVVELPAGWVADIEAGEGLAA